MKTIICKLLTSRDVGIANGDKVEDWNDLIYDFTMLNLQDFLTNPEEYSQPNPMITRTRKGTRKVRVSHYITCGICCRDDCKLDDKGLCSACEHKIEYFKMLERAGFSLCILQQYILESNL